MGEIGAPQKFFALFFAVIAVSSAALLARECDAPAPTIAFYRLGLTGLLVGTFGLLTRSLRWGDFDRRALLGCGLAGAFLGAHYVTWFQSLTMTTVASSVILVSLHPLGVAFLSGRVIRERVGKSSLVAILLAFSGALLVSWGDGGTSRTHLWGDLLAITAGGLFAGYFLVGRVLRQRLDLVPYLAMVYTCAAGLVLVSCWATASPVVGFDSRTYLFFLLLALVPTLVGHTLFNWALRYVKAHIVSLSQLGEPVGATVFAFFLFGEVPRASFYPAAGLILVGIALLVGMEKVRTRGKPREG